MEFPRCAGCNRFVLARWRRCLWCKRWTGQTHLKGEEALTAELHALATVGVVSSVGFLFWGAAFYDSPNRALFWGIEAYGLSLILSSLAALALPVALDVALALNLALIGYAVYGAHYAGLIAALVVSFAAARRKPLRALLLGSAELRGWEPPAIDITKCVHCGKAAAGILGARWVISGVFAAMITYSMPRPRCLTHARIAAIPATLVTFALGWWSIWGLFWTPNALYDNIVHGGIETPEGNEAAEQIARIGWFRYLLPGIAFVAGIGNWFVAVALLDRLSGR